MSDTVLPSQEPIPKLGKGRVSLPGWGHGVATAHGGAVGPRSQVLPPVKPSRKGGRPRADDRRCFEGILWILWTGAPPDCETQPRREPPATSHRRREERRAGGGRTETGSMKHARASARPSRPLSRDVGRHVERPRPHPVPVTGLAPRASPAVRSRAGRQGTGRRAGPQCRKRRRSSKSSA